MYKIVTPQEMSQAEKAAYKNGCSEVQFMEKAGEGVADFVIAYLREQYHGNDQALTLLCGKGNNGGDTYVAGCHLLRMGYTVSAIQVGNIKEATPLCQKYYQKFCELGGAVQIYSEESKPHAPGIIIDGLFGTGFHGQTEGTFASIINWANNTQLPIIAVDIPSGLNGTTGEVGNVAIKAATTLFLGHPKQGFFLNEGWNHTGTLHCIDFGLPSDIINDDPNQGVDDGYLTSLNSLKAYLPPMKRNRHKYQAGYVIALAGSPHMPGAAILSSIASLKAGAGIVRLFYPKGMEAELALAPYELIKQPYEHHDITDLLNELQRADALLIGPGMGTTPETDALLSKLLPQLKIPCVIDADALTLLAEKGYRLPEHTILTPHKGEMLRLLHMTSSSGDQDFLKQCQEYVDKHNITLVLKGAPTFIFSPNVPYLVNPTGDPGMATAGSGDVLTGIIAGLLAQNPEINTRYTAALGVYTHGLAGEVAARMETSYCMVASDILKGLPQAFYTLDLFRK